jgi:Glycosyl hydrolases family 17
VKSIGICNGMLGDNLPPGAEVVDMYKSYGIPAMRIYKPDSATLTALQGTNIDLVMGVANEDLASIGSDPAAASAWVQNNVLAYSGVSFK